MTREEAIAIIENEKKCVNRASKNDYCNRDCYNCELVKTDTEILTALDVAIKALEQEPCREADDYENEISDLYNRLDIVEYDKERLREEVTSLEEKLKGLSAEPCKDAISRQAVMDVIERWLECSGYNEAERHIMRAVQSVLYDSPSVNSQEPKTGHWIAVENEEMETVGYYCSECDLPMETEQRTNFCPNCGAKMVEPQESEE